jgi:HK97 family phage prohead protease
VPIDITDQYIRIRVAQPGSFEENSFRITWISRDDGIKAVIGRKKGEQATSVQSFLFLKDKWTVERAKKWVADHDYKIQSEDRSVGDGIELSDMPVYSGESALVRLFDTDLNSHIADSDITLADDPETSDILFEGYAVTDTLLEDRKLRIPHTAWGWDGAFDRYNGRVLGFHEQATVPIGKIEKYEVRKNKGLYVHGRIFAENPPVMLRALRERVLKSFSIGFQMIEWSYEEKTEILTVIKGQLKEVSLVNLPADPNAGFIIKNADDNTDVITHAITEGSQNMAEPIKEVIALQKLEEHQSTLGKKYDELSSIITAVREEQHKFMDAVITKEELQSRMEKILTDVEGIAKEVKEAKQLADINNNRVAYTDYRSMLTELSWLKDENGNKVPEVEQEAFCLFQLPVNYDKMQAGHELKNLRDLHDAVLFWDAIARFNTRGRAGYSIHKSKIFQQLVKGTERFSPNVALAMAGGNTGYGYEWVPSELSSEFNEYLRTVPTLSSKFETWIMPKGGSAKFPFQNGKAVVYKGSEALVDNATEARKTNVATGAKTFTPEVFIGALISSEELTEDSILDMVSFIRKELAMALDEGRESAIINGDDSATHFDNTVVTLYQTYQVETSWKGLRKLGLGSASYYRDIEVSSATTGVGALEIVNFTDCKGDMGVAGIKPGDCIYVTGLKGRTQTQTALYKEDALGVLAFMISGTLPTIDGSEIYVSAQYNEQLTSAGIYDSNTDVKHTSMCCAHKPSFRLAQRRGVTVEYNKNILTQQQQFVATARWDFGKISADAIYPVSEMINIQHTV